MASGRRRVRSVKPGSPRRKAGMSSVMMQCSGRSQFTRQILSTQGRGVQVLEDPEASAARAERKVEDRPASWFRWEVR